MDAINVNHIRDERLDLLETLQEHNKQLMNVLVPLIVTTGIREEVLQTLLIQYSLLYMVRRELGCRGAIHHTPG